MPCKPRRLPWTKKRRESRRSDRLETAWIWIGYVTAEGGDVTAAFVIDERQCADADATMTSAAEELRNRGIAHEFEHVRVLRDAPPEPLPSWAEYRQSLPDSAK